MHPRTLPHVVVLLSMCEACGPGRPRLDPPIDAGEDASETAPGSGGVRLLSDVAAPTQTDSSRGALGGAPHDAGVRTGPSDVALDDARSGDSCGDDCSGPFCDHLLITEVVTRPSGAEMIEIVNPTGFSVALSDYALSDNHLYYKVASGSFTTASGSDFAARFPDDATIGPGQYRVVSLINASGGSTSFAATYGKEPDFELRPTANGATDDDDVPNMQSAQATPSIGASASLTDGGEPVILFYYRAGALVSDVDYFFYGEPSTANPVVDKTAVTVGDSAYQADTPAGAQHQISAPGEGGSIHRCVYAETGEVRGAGNGLTGHDETSEDPRMTFALGKATSERTPGEGPPPSVCKP
jgi:hypothetical protein